MLFWFLLECNLRSGSILVSLGKPIPAENAKRNIASGTVRVNKSNAKIRPYLRLLRVSNLQQVHSCSYRYSTFWD